MTVAISVEDDPSGDLEAEIRSAWAWCVRSNSASQIALTAKLLRPGQPFDGGPQTVAGTSIARIMDALSPRITSEVIHAQAGSRIMLHAAAVAHPTNGSTMALVGPSGMGKTTLAGRLSKRLAYVTDETVTVRADGSVSPFPKPLSVRDFDIDMDGMKSQVSPRLFGLLPPPSQLQLTSIVILDRNPDGPDEPVVSLLGTLAGIMALAPEMSYLPRLNHPLRRLADLSDSCGGVRRLSYRESEDVTGFVLDELGVSA